MQDRHKFEQSVIAPTTEDLKAAVDAAKRGDASARETIVAALCWSAFCVSPQPYLQLIQPWLTSGLTVAAQHRRRRQKNFQSQANMPLWIPPFGKRSGQ